MMRRALERASDADERALAERTPEKRHAQGQLGDESRRHRDMWVPGDSGKRSCHARGPILRSDRIDDAGRPLRGGKQSIETMLLHRGVDAVGAGALSVPG